MPKQKTKAIPQMPFDDALRKILNAPPQHKKVKQKPQPKSKRS
jgi:hypothetical protein